MPIQFTDNAKTKLAANLAIGGTTLTVTASTGALFPAVTGIAGTPNYFVITMEDSAGNREFIRVNNRATDTFGSGPYPLIRGYWGSTARAWVANDTVDIRWSKNVISEYLTNISGRYLGSFSSAPTTDAYGGAIKEGDLYYDTVIPQTRVYTGAVWTGAATLAGAIPSTAISAWALTLVDDTTVEEARTTLGGTTLGQSLFTAADAAAARSTLGGGTVGQAVYTSVTALDARTQLSAAATGLVTNSGLTMTSARLLGRTTATTGAVEEVQVGSGLALAAGVLSVGAGIAQLGVAQTFTATQVADNGTGSVSATGTYTFDGADQIRTVTLTNAITVTFGAPTGITPNAFYVFRLAAGDTAARVFAWNSAYKFPAATAPLTSGTITNGASDIITFIGGASNTLLYVGHQADVR